MLSLKSTVKEKRLHIKCGFDDFEARSYELSVHSKSTNEKTVFIKGYKIGTVLHSALSNQPSFIQSICLLISGGVEHNMYAYVNE